MKIELLYFNDCPSWKAALKNLETALIAEAIEAEIRLIDVQDNEQATRLKFLGSPSFCINGQDWWPETRETYNLSCRVYVTPQGMRGLPTVEMLREKIQVLKSE
jgi:hypothetical protein